MAKPSCGPKIWRRRKCWCSHERAHPKYPGALAVDEVDHALDLIRVARLAIYAYEADPTNVSDLDIFSIGCVLTYAADVLQPVREQLNRDITIKRT